MAKEKWRIANFAQFKIFCAVRRRSVMTSLSKTSNMCFVSGRSAETGSWRMRESTILNKEKEWKFTQWAFSGHLIGKIFWTPCINNDYVSETMIMNFLLYIIIE
jgi:hypothetical protein